MYHKSYSVKTLKMKIKLKTLIFSIGLLGLLSLHSCSSNDDGPEVPENPESPENPEEPGATDLFVFSSLLRTPTATVSTVGLTEALTAVPDLDSPDNLEFEGFNAVLGPIDEGYFFVSNNDTGAVRYDLNEEGELVEGGSISFASTGQEGLRSPQTNYFVNDAKAYLFLANTPKFVIWNPTTLTITQVVDYPGEFIEDSPNHSFRHVQPEVQGDDIYLAVEYFNTDGNPNNTLPGVHALKINTITDEVTFFKDDRFFADGNWIGIAPNGDKYVFSHWDFPFVTATIRDESFNDFVLRIPDGSNVFDPDYAISLGQTTGINRPIAVLAMLSNGDVLMQVRQEDAPEWVEQFDGAVWEYAIAKYPNFTEFELVDELPPAPIASFRLTVNGELLINVFNEDYSQATLWQINTDGSATRVLEVPQEQTVREILRIREAQ